MSFNIKNIFKNQNEENHLINSLFLASLILLFHVMMIVVLGLLVLLLYGIVNYMIWIILGGVMLASGSVYLFFRYMKKDGGRVLQKMLSLPEFQGKNIEINFLCGIASLKIRNENEGMPKIENNTIPVSMQIEDPQAVRFRELMELARLHERNLITFDEYNQAKEVLFNK